MKLLIATTLLFFSAASMVKPPSTKLTTTKPAPKPIQSLRDSTSCGHPAICKDGKPGEPLPAIYETKFAKPSLLERTSASAAKIVLPPELH